MNLLSRRPASPEAAALRARVFNVLPAASYGMEKLFGLLDLVLSDETPTAAVECRAKPRLLLNRAFVAEHCRADTDLFLLILHELHHVILGHTRLFPRLTPTDNLAFDAVINAMLCQSVGRTAGTGLFTRLYDFGRFPERLLRPPPGWPHAFGSALRPLPPDEAAVIRLLYGPPAGGVTYLELHELLRRQLGAAIPGVLLLGDHGPAGPEDPLLRQTLRRLVEDWPPPPRPLRGRDEGREARDDWLTSDAVPGREFRRAFARLLTRCGLRAGRPAHRRRLLRPDLRESSRVTVLPDVRDRRSAALRVLTGHEPLVRLVPAVEPRPRRQPVPLAHVYLDVSGSMRAALPHLAAVCREPFRRGELQLFAFSTVVSELTGRDLVRAAFANTAGTDINCVLRHLAELPLRRRPRVVLVATDGYVGPARADLLAQLKAVRFVAALTGEIHRGDLAAFAHELADLPAP
jgi:hypothetical protein